MEKLVTPGFWVSISPLPPPHLGEQATIRFWMLQPSAMKEILSFVDDFGTDRATMLKLVAEGICMLCRQRYYTYDYGVTILWKYLYPQQIEDSYFLPHSAHYSFCFRCKKELVKHWDEISEKPLSD